MLVGRKSRVSDLTDLRLFLNSDKKGNFLPVYVGAGFSFYPTSFELIESDDSQSRNDLRLSDIRLIDPEGSSEPERPEDSVPREPNDLLLIYPERS